MCGIWAVFGCTSKIIAQCNAAYKISHRGPDAFRLESIYKFPSCCLGYHRLAILDSPEEMQPIRVTKYPHIWLIFDGEIYNYMNLQSEFDFKSVNHCDAEAIIHLYAQEGIDFAVRQLDGVFAFCLLDTSRRKIFLGRDTFGVKPLSRIITEDGFFSICSEIKGLMDVVEQSSKEKIHHVLPGYVETYSLDNNCKVSFENMKQFHQIGDFPSYTIQVGSIDGEVKATIRTLLHNAVSKTMTKGRRIGCLLSGGLDSSLMTALLVKSAKEQNLPYPIRTFSIGMEVSSDILAARKVAKFLGTDHHEFIFTPEEAIAAVENVIYQMENYDPVTVRGAIGMYLVCKYVKEKTDTTVILSGEGADEIAQGYIYFHKTPSAHDADKESRQLCKDLSIFDIQRVDRMPATFGLQVHVPYLDHWFSSYYLSLDNEMKVPRNGIEKYLLRSAFEDTDLLPKEVLWRSKLPFSDGLTTQTKALADIIEDFAKEKKNKLELDQRCREYSHNAPDSNESMYYREIFEKHYSGQEHLIPYFWNPKW